MYDGAGVNQGDLACCSSPTVKQTNLREELAQILGYLEATDNVVDGIFNSFDNCPLKDACEGQSNMPSDINGLVSAIKNRATEINKRVVVLRDMM